MWRIGRVVVTATFLGCAAFLAASAATAQSLCGERSKIVETLATQYGEHPRTMALIPPSTVLEVLVSDDNETWTIIATTANGVSCVLTRGRKWTAVNPPAKDRIFISGAI